VSLIERFFTDIDTRWKAASGERIPLRLIGATALMLQADYERGTKDSDVIETKQLSGDSLSQARTARCIADIGCT
jgi:hypothetical protein